MSRLAADARAYTARPFIAVPVADLFYVYRVRGFRRDFITALTAGELSAFLAADFAEAQEQRAAQLAREAQMRAPEIDIDFTL